MTLTNTKAAESRMRIGVQRERAGLAGRSGRSLGALVMVALACLVLPGMARSQSAVAWGDDNWGQCEVPNGLQYIQIAGGSQHSVALRSDGAVLAWGLNTSGQCNVPMLPTGLHYAGVAAGSIHTVALRSRRRCCRVG